MSRVDVELNGRMVSAEVEDRTLLVDFLRETRNLTGTHVGCDTSQCGACVVHVDGKAVNNRIKDFITQEERRVEPKGVDAFFIPAVGHLFFSFLFLFRSFCFRFFLYSCHCQVIFLWW